MKYVPFLQIHDNNHKSRVGSMRADKRFRIFYPTKASRDFALAKLNSLGKSMAYRASRARREVEAEDARRRSIIERARRGSLLEEVRELEGSLHDIDKELLEIQQCWMEDPTAHHINDYAGSGGVYGLDVGEKLFWHAYVADRDISWEKGSDYDTGRPSMPEFQDMNVNTLRNWKEKPAGESNPRPVLWHGGCGGKLDKDAPASDPMSPLGLLMAYEDNDAVIPVVSDFDCFLLGTRGVRYNEPLGAMELSSLTKCVDEIGGILATPKADNDWTMRWLEAKKKRVKSHSAHETPPFGYADPVSAVFAMFIE